MSSEVKRYEVYGHDWDSEENPFGFWVRYSDYAAHQQQDANGHGSENKDSK